MTLRRIRSSASPPQSTPESSRKTFQGLWGMALACLALAGAGCSDKTADRTPPVLSTQRVSPPISEAMTKRVYDKPSDDVIKAKLSRLSYEVTQNEATEPPFQNEFWNNKAEGLYVDVVSGEPLFSSRDKFESGTGWPSFTKPVDMQRVTEHKDSAYGMVRVEVRSRDGNSHLGHVFDDGPAPSNVRYCINSASLRFIPVSELEKEGYGEYRSFFDASGVTASDGTNNACAAPEPGQKAACNSSLETAILAGGCFWGMEELLRDIPGVLDTDVGYTGGTSKAPTYEVVKTGGSGHAESVRIVFDPSKVSFETLLEKWFFKMHDPTTKNKQGNDIGSQYRSAIFFTNDAQREVAEKVKKRIEDSGKWGAPLVTEIVAATEFTAAEGYHQDYLEKNPNGYTCHFMRD